MTVHIAVFVNPSAGKGRARAVAATASTRLRGAGASVVEYAGVTAEETRDLARRALAARPDVLVVVGGDGTLAGILDVVCENSVPIAVVPAGTGNDLARSLGVPMEDPAAAALLALRGRRRTIDVGRVRSGDGTRHFLTVAALGFDARVSDRTDRLRWPRGPLRYYLALLIELVRLRPLRFRIAIDQAEPRDAPGVLVAVGNTASYGGGMPMCIGASPDDGLLDIVRVGPLGRLRLLRVFPRLLHGTHLDLPEVEHFRGRSVEVSAPGLIVYADGERVATSSCVIDIRDSALTVMAPAGGETSGSHP